MLTAALLMVAKIQRQPKRPLTEDWIKKMWYGHIMEHYSATKRMKYCHLQQHEWTLRILREAKFSLSEKAKNDMTPFICGL